MRDCFYSCFLRIFKSQKMPGDNPRLLEALSLEKTSVSFCIGGMPAHALL